MLPSHTLWQTRKNSAPLHPLCAWHEVVSNNLSMLAMPLLAAAKINPALDKTRTTGHVSLDISYNFMYEHFKMFICMCFRWSAFFNGSVIPLLYLYLGLMLLHSICRIQNLEFLNFYSLITAQ